MKNIINTIKTWLKSKNNKEIKIKYYENFGIKFQPSTGGVFVSSEDGQYRMCRGENAWKEAFDFADMIVSEQTSF